jgi:light-regulated signal transduction histidine kinase (bacteriophytochrome)
MDALHVLAQPLTILRSSVPLAADGSLAPAKRRRFLDISAQQIERACVLFELVQDLTVVTSRAAKLAPLELSAVLSEALDGEVPALNERGVAVNVLSAEPLAKAYGDADRTLQAILAGLRVVAARSAPGDTIQIETGWSELQVQLVIRNQGSQPSPLDPVLRLSILLAEANMLSQKGKFECAADLCSAFLTLPRHDAMP